jgi:hypothetical protein
MAASVGKLSEVTSVFKKANDISNGGVLFTLPALLSNGLLKHTKKYFSLPPGYYSIRHVFMTLAFITLLRIKSIEAIQYSSPGELGKILGLDRIPEIKTVRKKLGILSEQDEEKKWSKDLSKEWLSSNSDIAGILYIDGHVRVYHGKKTKLPKRYVTRQKLCLRGMTDYWVNDALGQPYFVVPRAQNSGLLATLKEEIIPRLLKEIPCWFGDDPLQSRFSIVFDREGYSPEFFKWLWEEHRISCYTYKKYPGKNWGEDKFKEKEVKLPSGEIVKMKLAEKTTFLGKKVKVKEIRKLSDSGHQTAIVTTDFTTTTEEIAANMFTRWTQENFFKYMQEHFGIDRLIEYEQTPMDETIRVPNPEYRELEGRVRSMAQKMRRMVSKFGTLILEMETVDSDKMKKCIEKKAELQENIESYKKQLEKLKLQKKKIPSHLMIKDLPEESKFNSLSYKKKYIMDTIKMIAYRAETAMAIMMNSKISKIPDNRALLRQIFSSEVNIDPDEKAHTLTVTLHSLSNERSNKIAAVLCDKLNETETIFPGTNMRIIYKSVAL